MMRKEFFVYIAILLKAHYLLFIAKFHKHDAAHRFIEASFGNGSIRYSLSQCIVDVLNMLRMLTNDNHITTGINGTHRIVID